MYSRRSNQKGLALIAVLLVFAICAVISAHILHRNYLDFRRTANYINGLQADYYALGGEQLARQYLYQDMLQDRKKNISIDHLSEDWALAEHNFETEGGQIRVKISDAQARLNLNSFAVTNDSSPGAISALTRMGFAVETSAKLLDWIDSDSQPRSGGAEDSVYTSRIPPSLTPNTLMGDVSEMKAVGVESKLYNEKSQMLTALPTTTSVNINTASQNLLDAMFGVSGVGAKIVSLRKIRPIESLNDLTEQGIAIPSQLTSQLGVASRYFEVNVDVVFNDYYRRLRCLVLRDTDERGVPRIRTVRRTIEQVTWLEQSSSEGNRDNASRR